MPSTRGRRIVRRAVIVLAGVVLLPVWYVCSVATLIFLLNATIVPLNGVTQPLVEGYVAPLWWYIDTGWETGWPGAKACDQILACSKAAGQQVSGK